MNGQNKWVIALSVIVGVLFFVFVGLAVSYYTSNLIARASNVTSTEDVPSKSAKESSDIQSLEEMVQTQENNVHKNESKIYNMGIEEMVFRQRFNRVADDELSELNLHLAREFVYNGDYASVYQTPLDRTTSLAISYEPDTELVRGVFLSGKPVSDDETVLFLGAIADIVATLNPDLTPSGRRALLQNLGMFDGKHTDYRTVNKSTHRNNVHYKLQGTGGNGVAFWAVAKDIGTEAGASIKRDSPYNIMADMTNYIIWVYDNQEQAKTSEYRQEESKTETNENILMDDTYAEINAKQVLKDFHFYITYKKYWAAYGCLSQEFQNTIDYNKWVDGFQTTTTSTVLNITAVSKSTNEIVLTYLLMASDNPGGEEKYNGRATLIKVGDEWKIDDILNKKID